MSRSFPECTEFSTKVVAADVIGMLYFAYSIRLFQQNVQNFFCSSQGQLKTSAKKAKQILMAVILMNQHGRPTALVEDIAMSVS